MLIVIIVTVGALLLFGLMFMNFWLIALVASGSWANHAAHVEKKIELRTERVKARKIGRTLDRARQAEAGQGGKPKIAPIPPPPETHTR